jgi:polyisoprenoid-binding protein YceI
VVAASKLDIRILVASIITTNAVLDGEIKDERWFDTVKYPNISFKATKVTMTGPGKVDVVGDLTLHGMTKPRTGNCRIASSPSALRSLA